MRSQRPTRSQAKLNFDSLDGRVVPTTFGLVHFDHIVQGAVDISSLNQHGHTHTGNGFIAEKHDLFYSNRHGNGGTSQFHVLRTIEGGGIRRSRIRVTDRL